MSDDVKSDRFIFHRTYLELANCFPNTELKAEFFTMLCRYALDGEPPEVGSPMFGAFEMIREKVDRGRARKRAQRSGIQPEEDEVVVDETAVARRLPTRQEMAMYAAQLNIPSEYLAEFYAEMEARGWTYMKGPDAVVVNRRNFKAVLGTFWRAKRRFDEAERRKRPEIYQEEGYEWK